MYVGIIRQYYHFRYYNIKKNKNLALFEQIMETEMFADDFTREMRGTSIVEKVNLSRASLKEAVTFKERIFDNIIHNHLDIIVDMSTCYFIDSTFLGTLVLIHKKLKEKSGRLRMVTNSPRIIELMGKSGLTKFLDVFTNLEEAVKGTKINLAEVE